MGLDLERVLLWYGAFLASTVLHEAAHAWVAFRLGDPTAYHGGQVSLDPRAHVRREPIGTVVVPLLSLAGGGMMLGWASAPYDPVWAMRSPRRAAAMALAGPLANLLLVLLAAIAIRAGVAAGVFGPPAALAPAGLAVGHGAWAAAATLLSVLFTLNLTLAVLNLLPVPPLDGGGAVPLLLPEEAGRTWRRLTLGSPVFAALGLLLAFQVVGPAMRRLFLAAANLLWSGTAAYG
ncbi:MAG: site-2 protease family protein [bacterium]|nr:site-2 protease family protein [bacterium]